MVEEIDASKAQQITEIEKDLNNQQAALLQSARDEIDRLNEKAANLKIGAIQQAQAKATEEVNQITAQATALGESSTLRATGTTTIKTEVSGGTTNKGASVTTTGALVTGTKTTETKTSQGTRQSTSSTKN